MGYVAPDPIVTNPTVETEGMLRAVTESTGMAVLNNTLLGLLVVLVFVVLWAWQP